MTLSELNHGIFPDVLCFSETFIKCGEEKNINIHNYELAAHYSRNKKRGGTCILVKKGIEYKKITIFDEASANFHFECCSIKLLYHNIIIVCVYRSSTATKKRHLEYFFDKLVFVLNKYIHRHPKQKIVIVGDININTIIKNSATNHLTDILHNYNLTQHITEPTRGLSCIDHIFSNVKGATGMTLPLNLSDHDTAQILSFSNKSKLTPPKTTYIYRRDYSSENIEKFKNYIASLSFSDVYSESDPNAGFNIFHDWLCLLYKLCFPFIKVRLSTKHNLHWITKGIRRSCAKNRVLRQNYYKKKTYQNKHKYKAYSKLLKKCILCSKKNSNNKYVLKSKNTCKATWKVIQGEIDVKSQHNNYIEYIECDSNIICCPQKIANTFNTFFIELTNKDITNNILINKSNPILNNSIYLNPIDEYDINKVIMTLNNSNSEGYDGICTKVIKACNKEISSVLAFLINSSMITGKFPEKLKFSLIKPLFKKDDKSILNNYRPIALVPIISKIYEKVMHIKLTSFFDKYHVLKRSQYGFQKGKSTAHAVFDMINETLTCLNENNYTTALYFDMSKAFDFVSHDSLLQKLENCGIRGIALSWIKTYLQNRRQSVEISRPDSQNVVRKHISDPKVNKYGVPQGSVLGPLLFLVYINNLADAIKHKCILFADDISVIVKTNSKLTLNDHTNDINNTVKAIIKWLKINNLVINLDKTYFINFNDVLYQTMNINFEGHKLKSTNTIKFLGIWIDQKLNWKNQVENVCKKINRFSYALYKLTKVATKNTALTAYFAYVESVLRYGLILWGNSTDANKAFIAQKKCIRAICGTAPDEPCRRLFKSLNVLPLPCLYIFEIAKFVKLNMYYFRQAKDVYTRNTRNGNRIVSEIVPRSARFKKNCFWMCMLIFNKIPHNIKDLPYNIFKGALYSWLIGHCFYNVNEFLNMQ